MNAKHLLFAAALVASAPVGLFADDPVEPPVPVRTVPPKFPTELRREGVGGVVTVNFLIDEKGSVQDPKVEKTSNDAFNNPALEALKKWKFKPAKKAGVAVALRVSLPIQFSISDE
jgi:protein TonB